MIDDAEHAAGFQHVEERLEHARRGVGHHPVVHVAEGEDHVGGIVRAEIRRLAVELDELGVAVFGGIAGEFLVDGVLVLRVFAFLASSA